ncbi:PREDICTED: apolipoprotein B-100-like, partial [Thamnophis sirtalis]|uniref:Apolipoprotein B-100-like n=1 Tax=Thamnophis sirtalis TaxID=35019 RepID=A0A6I9XQ85_9SAUR
MGHPQLWPLLLLLLLSNEASTRDATRFKPFRKYIYDYETEITNGVAGTADSHSGSKIKCKVELEVPQLHNFVLKMNQCILEEVYGIDAQGKALLKKSKNSDEFAAAMSQFYSQKKIITPELTDVANFVTSLLGNECSGNEDLTFLTLRNAPLSTLISSNQHCQYTVDTKKKHISEAICTEKHLFLPSSYKNQYGMMAKVIQTLKYESIANINNRNMDGKSLSNGFHFDLVPISHGRQGSSPPVCGLDIMKGIMLNFEKMLKEISSKQQTPDVKAYFRIFQEELGYLKLSDINLLGNVILKSFKTLQSIPQKIVQAISQGAENDLMAHYIFMDNEFELPTSAGLQLQVAFSGIATPGAKVGMKISQRNIHADLVFKPSMAVEFITHLGVNIPEFARNGIQMNTNIYHESGIETNVALKAGHLKFTFPAPKGPIKLFSMSNVLHLVTPTRTEVIPPLIENRVSRHSCSPFFTGLKFCTRIEYSNASSTNAAPYYPLTGETRFEIELQPTGKVKEYIASANYELNKEGKDLVDTLKFIAQAKGVKESEAKIIFTFNRGRKIFTSDFQAPGFNIDFGTNLKITDSSNQGKKVVAFILDIINKKSPEITITGSLSSAAGRESSMEAAISIPRLQTQAKTDISYHRSSNGVIFQIDSSATSYGSSVSERIVLRYDTEKVEIQWNSGTSASLKRMSANLPVDVKDYSKALQKKANGLLDHKVANTDMTLRHIISHFIVATNTWLEKTSKDIPYVQNLQDKLSKLQQLDFQITDVITIPEELFFKSDGKITYVWNKDSTFITIPVPFGGQSSQDMSVPKTLRAPALVVESLGLNIPSQEYKIPQFTIPDDYTLRV